MTLPSIVLVHGNFGTAASWGPFHRALASRGYDVHSVDLPWKKTADTGELPHLQDYVSTLVRVVKDLRVESVVLVPHSYGGIVVSQAVEELQKETWALVYLNAHVLQHGETFGSVVPPAMLEAAKREAAETGGWWFHKSIPVEVWASNFYNDASPEKAEEAWHACHEEPLSVWMDPVTLPESFSKTSRPSIFIRFLDDKCLPAEHWPEMAKRLPNSTTWEMPGSHFAFATHPEEVADVFEKALQTVL